MDYSTNSTSPTNTSTEVFTNMASSSSYLPQSVEMPNTNIVVRSSGSVSPAINHTVATLARPPQVVRDGEGNRFLLYEYTTEEETEENLYDNEEMSQSVEKTESIGDNRVRNRTKL